MQQMNLKKTSQHTVNQLGLQTLKAIVVLMIFFGMSMFFASNGANALEESLAPYKDNPQHLLATFETNF